MKRPEATEFEVYIQARLEGGWKWKINATNGCYPRFLEGSRFTGGEALTHWGAKRQGRKALKKIHRYQRLQEEAA